MIEVFVATSEDIVRCGLQSAFEGVGDIAVVGELAYSPNLVDQVLRAAPDVVVWDLATDDITSNNAKQIKELLPASRILVFTQNENEKHIFEALAAGADGYVLSHSSIDQLRNAIRNVATGVGWLDPTIGMRLLQRLGSAYEGAAENEVQRRLWTNRA